MRLFGWLLNYWLICISESFTKSFSKINSIFFVLYDLFLEPCRMFFIMEATVLCVDNKLVFSSKTSCTPMTSHFEPSMRSVGSTYLKMLGNTPSRMWLGPWGQRAFVQVQLLNVFTWLLSLSCPVGAGQACDTCCKLKKTADMHQKLELQRKFFEDYDDFYDCPLFALLIIAFLS